MTSEDATIVGSDHVGARLSPASRHTSNLRHPQKREAANALP